MSDIYTPCGSPVVTWCMAESSTSARAGFDSYYAQTYPNAEQIPPSEFVGDQHFFVEDEEDFLSFMLNMKLDVVIYSTIPLN